MRHCICLLVLLFSPVLTWASPSVEQPGEAAIDFLYINANAGEAAGGHTALRLGDSVFHYQFFPDSRFLLVREPWGSFRFLYNDLHNRSIAIASLPLDPSVSQQIRNHFTELLVAQQGFFDTFEVLRQEEQLLQQVENGQLEVSVDCLGFFDPQKDRISWKSVFQRSAMAVDMDFLKTLAAKADEALQLRVAQLNKGKRPGQDLQEILAWREALLVLVNGKSLQTDAVISPTDEEGSLSVSEQEGLEAFSETLVQAIAKLLESKRPDRGETLLLQIARYLAVQQSLAEGHFVSLDPFFTEVRVVQLSDEEVGNGRLEALQKELWKHSTIRRELFFTEKQHLEIAYSLLETSRARAWELSRVNDTQRTVRILAKVTLPTRPEMVLLQIGQLQEEPLKITEKLLEQELFDMQEKSDELYGYNLFWRNCATELVRSLNGTFPDSDSGREALGGWMEPGDGLIFIPFLFYEQSITAYSLEDEQFLQARRLRNLDTLYSQDNDLWVWLRESNTLSSTLYEPRGKDSPFLFFTDDSLVLRPILGVFNVAYATLHGVAGVLSLPFDGGEKMNQAGRGIFYSLPELAFGNIRKGSYPAAEEDYGN